MANRMLNSTVTSNLNERTPPVFPWFGIDIGGSLVKLVYFEPIDLTQEEIDLEGTILSNIRHYLTSNKAYDDVGIRDSHLELQGVILRGRKGNIHFIRFPTSAMHRFVKLCVEKNLHTLTIDVFCTGGGAYKFENLIRESLKLNWIKCDEIDTLIRGIHYLASRCPDECFHFESPGDKPTTGENLIRRNVVFNDHYPYLLVNVGTGVSVLKVESQQTFSRVTGSSIGGGTFTGLCKLLTGCENFEDAIQLAAEGDSDNVDKLVKDIYGGDYDRFGLGSNVVASSFGSVGQKSPDPPRREDLARATLVTILNNLCSIICLCAKTMDIDRIMFVGSFLRVNDLSLRQISMAMHYWTSGSIKPIFLRHEGYMGAFGCLRSFIFDNGDAKIANGEDILENGP